MNWSFAPLVYAILFLKAIVAVTIAVEDAAVCPPIYHKGILHMPFKVAFLNAEDDKVIVTSFANNGEPDVVAVIRKISKINFDKFNNKKHVKTMTGTGAPTDTTGTRGKRIRSGQDKRPTVV